MLDVDTGGSTLLSHVHDGTFLRAVSTAAGQALVQRQSSQAGGTTTWEMWKLDEPVPVGLPLAATQVRLLSLSPDGSRLAYLVEGGRDGQNTAARLVATDADSGRTWDLGTLLHAETVAAAWSGNQLAITTTYVADGPQKYLTFVLSGIGEP